jgi:hypothetical protein
VTEAATQQQSGSQQPQRLPIMTFVATAAVKISAMANHDLMWASNCFIHLGRLVQLLFPQIDVL